MKISKRAERFDDDSIVIVIDEGDGEKIIAYRLECPVNNQKVQKVNNIFGITHKELRRAIKQSLNGNLISMIGSPFTFVVIGHDNGNYGYFADACFFWTSMHSDRWEFVPVAGWTEKYDRHHIDMSEKKNKYPTSVNLFLKDYPEFKELFG